MEKRYVFWPLAVRLAMSSSMWSSASGPPTSGLSPLDTLPDATQCDQSVCTSPISTWNPAVDEPHMNPAGKATSFGGAAVEPPELEEWHAATSASAATTPPGAFH